MELRIHTLGDFDVSFEEQSILGESNRSYKLIKLLEYFITFRGRKLLPETIIENLWSDNEYSDPKNVLRTQIFRLRQVLKKTAAKGIDISQCFNINFSNGYYCFELGRQAVLDVEEFETYINQGDKVKENDINEAIKLFKKALQLYKGPYLSENAYEVWLIPIRNHYRRLYLKTIFKLLEMYKEKEDYAGIIEQCEEVIITEPYEEALHIYLIEAMLKIGQIKNAMSHYEYVTSLLSREMGIKSSPALKDVYRKIQNYYDEKSEASIKSIMTKLEESSVDGALLCDSDYFRFLYNIEKRKGLREDRKNIVMSLITMDYHRKNNNNDELTKIIKIMSSVLHKSLRKGDIYSFWNDTQILIMLNGAREEGLEKIKTRIMRNFNNMAKTNICKINVEFLPVMEDRSII
jgi:DNA-binding SARP family transcriptional activator